jgi:hypothetical protein
MKEWTRTIILIVLILAGIAYMIWAHHAATDSLLQGVSH